MKFRLKIVCLLEQYSCFFLQTSRFLLLTPQQVHSHSDLRELLLGEVQRVVDDGDSIFVQVGSFWQVCTEDTVVGNIHERNHGVPALVVVPNLWKEDKSSFLSSANLKDKYHHDVMQYNYKGQQSAHFQIFIVHPRLH